MMILGFLGVGFMAYRRNANPSFRLAWRNCSRAEGGALIQDFFKKRPIVPINANGRTHGLKSPTVIFVLPEELVALRVSQPGIGAASFPAWGRASAVPRSFCILRGSSVLLAIHPLPPKASLKSRSDDHFRRQLCWQVCAWLSHALKQGVLKVSGQTRLQDTFWLEQLAIQASELLSAIWYFPSLNVPVALHAIAESKNKNSAPETALIAVSIDRSTLDDLGEIANLSQETRHWDNCLQRQIVVNSTAFRRVEGGGTILAISDFGLFGAAAFRRNNQA
jgi:hypothetical protein